MHLPRFRESQGGTQGPVNTQCFPLPSSRQLWFSECPGVNNPQIIFLFVCFCFLFFKF